MNKMEAAELKAVYDSQQEHVYGLEAVAKYAVKKHRRLQLIEAIARDLREYRAAPGNFQIEYLDDVLLAVEEIGELLL